MVVQGALRLACTAQRYPVIATGQRVFAQLFGPGTSLVPQDLEMLKKRLPKNIEQSIDLTDEYEVNLLEALFESLDLTDQLPTGRIFTG